MISNELIELQEQLIRMAYCTVRKRLAKVLVDLSKKEVLCNIENKGINISREDLASLIGSANETAIRMLTDFKDKKLLIIGPHKEIILSDEKKLAEIALFG